MLEGTLVYSFVGDRTHGNAGLVFFGDIPESDRGAIAKTAVVSVGAENVPSPSTVFVTAKDIKDYTFDVKFYGPSGDQAPFDGNGIFAAARAAADRYKIPSGAKITFIPDPQFGKSAAPQSVRLGVNGAAVSLVMNPVGMRLLSPADPRHAVLMAAMPGIAKAEVYKTALDDLMVMCPDAKSVRNKTTEFNRAWEKLAELDPSLYGLVVVAPGKSGLEVTLQSGMGLEAGCCTLGPEVVQLANRFGILLKSASDETSLDLISPHHVADTGELGSFTKMRYSQKTGKVSVKVETSVAGSLYFDRGDNGAFKQYSIASAPPPSIVPIKTR